MDPQQIIGKGREALIKELNLGELSEEDQNKILDELAQKLLRRVLLKLFDLMPEGERDNFQNLLKSSEAEAQTLVQKYIPNSSEIIGAELRAGIDEHKRLVAGQAAK